MSTCPSRRCFIARAEAPIIPPRAVERIQVHRAGSAPGPLRVLPRGAGSVVALRSGVLCVRVTVARTSSGLMAGTSVPRTAQRSVMPGVETMEAAPTLVEVFRRGLMSVNSAARSIGQSAARITRGGGLRQRGQLRPVVRGRQRVAFASERSAGGRRPTRSLGWGCLRRVTPSLRRQCSA